MHMSKKCFCLPRNWIYLFYLLTFFELCIYLNNIYKTLEGIGKIQFVSELTILLNLQISKFHGSLHKEKN